MKAVLLSVHVLLAVILIGPITVAASVFPRYARSAATSKDPAHAPGLPVAAAMHRISRGYAVPAIAVPVFGVGLGAAMHVLDQKWLIISMVLTGVAALLLLMRIIPAQSLQLRQLSRSPAPVGASAPLGSVDQHSVSTHETMSRKQSDSTQRSLRLLGMHTGMFATLWAVVVVLMIVRPGSSTGV